MWDVRWVYGGQSGICLQVFRLSPVTYFTSALYVHNHLSQMLGVIVAVDACIK